ncbi:MOSC domain containing protein [Leptothrix cholodnii SP-6]|uniref:MOSC domain containing protein n=1 Tax=Leptothrix cholodnii (strain ATCC 51168 / LMG 8142 / SP-6) TaxID=395495 RepID=B1Y0E7_LEPCP|nr:MOSC domain-containing protein [Leptothrix cholodnii]ACB36626.1 MOSC domain containing protein [Leptothrix cholodnii SP-6]
MQLLSLNLGTVRPLMIDGRRIMTAIGKAPVAGPVAVGRLGLAGDEQADPSVHGGLDKAIYAWPGEHYAWWQAQRRERGTSLFDETLPAGFAGENLTLQGLDEQQVWVGDELHFPDCVLRVTQPREPCFKFNAVMGYAQAARDMVTSGRSGWYLAVQQPGTLEAGQPFELRAGSRSVGIAQALAGKRHKHLR